MVAAAGVGDRAQIFRLRHDVYARELRQHAQNPAQLLRDELDERNVNIVARRGSELAGFVSITPPGGRYSLDKYLDRSTLPFPCDDGTFEIRLLTVASGHRARAAGIAPLLAYAAMRWVEAHGGTRVIAIGRQEILPFYIKMGLVTTDTTVTSGAVSYRLMHADIDRLRRHAESYHTLTTSLLRDVEWKLNFPAALPAACYHGGAFFDAVGDGFDDLQRGGDIINADVLDAWFPPAPGVIESLEQHLPWLLRTSPPTDCSGFVRAIAAARDVDGARVLVGAGSSDLIFRALPRLLDASSRVLILDPMYGEYAHVLERVMGCRVDRLRLDPDCSYDVDASQLSARLRRVRYDAAVIVNPNNPTGRLLDREALLRVIAGSPHTTFWIDETYVDYVGRHQSLEQPAAVLPNVLICKSMSKAYALSGARAAYLLAAPRHVALLRAWTPPWAVSLPAQVAAVRALEDPAYYAARWAETGRLRTDFAADLLGSGWEVVGGVGNFLLCHLPGDGPPARELVSRARNRGLFLRDASTMGSRMSCRAIRIAVKDATTNACMLNIIRTRDAAVDWIGALRRADMSMVLPFQAEESGRYPASRVDVMCHDCSARMHPASSFEPRRRGSFASDHSTEPFKRPPHR
jgi:histidinol-phosphate/aromatic aminotransferase/cobyric acid decarboxylase-like protein